MCITIYHLSSLINKRISILLVLSFTNTIIILCFRKSFQSNRFWFFSTPKKPITLLWSMPKKLIDICIWKLNFLTSFHRSDFLLFLLLVSLNHHNHSIFGQVNFITTPFRVCYPCTACIFTLFYIITYPLIISS